MKLTILGRYGPYPDANGACSGYLLQKDSYAILLECGNGVLSRLQQYLFPWELDAVIVSHLHGDHISDLSIMRYAMDIAQNRGITEKALDVYLPEKPHEEIERISFKNAYCIHTLNEQSQFHLGPFHFSFLSVKHPMPCLAIRIETKDKTLVYSGDTEYVSELEGFAKNADLFLCEANYQNEEIEAAMGNHLSAAQAAQIACKAETQGLVLTHLPPFKDIETSLKEAQKFYPEAILAQENATITL